MYAAPLRQGGSRPDEPWANTDDHSHEYRDSDRWPRYDHTPAHHYPYSGTQPNAVAHVRPGCQRDAVADSDADRHPYGGSQPDGNTVANADPRSPSRPGR